MQSIFNLPLNTVTKKIKRLRYFEWDDSGYLMRNWIKAIQHVFQVTLNSKLLFQYKHQGEYVNSEWFNSELFIPN